MKKYYAVKKGRKTGIYYSWEECKKQVDKYQGAQYKSFILEEDAKKYLGEENKIKKEQQPKLSKSIIRSKQDDHSLTADQKQAYDHLLSGKNIFLTGGAGTGKSFVLNHFIETNDLVFFISLNGEMSNIVDFAKQMKMKGIYMISITKMISNSLARLCDENLYIQSLSISVDKELEYDVTTPYFILIELLYIKYKMYLESEHIPIK